MVKTDRPFPYQIIKKVGSGAFGDVYKASHSNNKNVLVAVKCEDISENDKKRRLFEEYKIYTRLGNNNIHVGIPNVYFSGLANIIEPDNTGEVVNNSKSDKNMKNVIVIDYLGPNLDKLYSSFKKQFSIKTILMIAIQCLDRIQFIHNNGIIHRDIKPDNFLIGQNADNISTIFIVDFGLSKKYIDYTSFTINKFGNTRSFTGTYRFCSMRNHKYIEQSRRDDLESLGYMILYFFKGSLPWQDVNEDEREKRNELIYAKKRDTSIIELCNGAPDIMIEYITYCRLLRYDEIPNYDKLRNLFIDEINKRKYTLDYKFDWYSLLSPSPSK
jgi:serine/threonine protein kinase